MLRKLDLKSRNAEGCHGWEIKTNKNEKQELEIILPEILYEKFAETNFGHMTSKSISLFIAENSVPLFMFIRAKCTKNVNSSLQKD